jgi:hypothetical protein
MEFDAPADSNIEGKIAFTYDGASPSDPGPAGTLVRMLIAQLGQDEATLKQTVTEKTLANGKPQVPGKDISVTLKDTQYEGDDKSTAVIMADLLIDGQANQMPFVLFKEPSGWKVDMNASIERMMGGSMEQLTSALEEGMKQMAEGMQGMMEGIGQAMSEAFGSTGAPIGEESTHPDAVGFAESLRDTLSLNWRICLDEDRFAVASPELVKDLLDALLEGITKASRTGWMDQLETIQTLDIRKEYEAKQLKRVVDVLRYTVGSTEDGRADYFDRGVITTALMQALAV